MSLLSDRSIIRMWVYYPIAVMIEGGIGRLVYCAHAQQAWMSWSPADRSFHHSTIPPSIPFHRSIESRLPDWTIDQVLMNTS